MKAPNGEDITCWSMSDSDYCGALKVDELTIQALDKIRSCLDLLLKDGKIKWQGTLRDTYNKYLHPDGLIYENDEMYKLLYNGDVINAFQYETEVGGQALRKIQPHKFNEVIAGNSLMRLASKSKEQPLDKYVRFKRNINLWYEEMASYGLNEEEIKIMEKHLKHLYGVADTQEVVMLLVMDEHISNFTLKEANLLRKSIAKKRKDLVEESRELFFKKGLEIGTRVELLNYVWEEQITPQLGYSFSVCHTTPYSGILLQEMNLAYIYGHMYWKCACLSVNSGAVGENANTDYGKIAKAVCEMNDIVTYPSINNSEEGFTIFNDKILYGLRALTSIGENEINVIKENRPYSSFQDFIDKCGNSMGDGAITNLIKSGCFNDFGVDKVKLMEDYLNSICNKKYAFTLSNVPMLLDMELIDTNKYANELRYYGLYKTICTKANLVKYADRKGEWCRVDNSLVDEFLSLYQLQEDKDYFYDVELNSYVAKKSVIKKQMDSNIETMTKEVLNNKEIVNQYNEIELQKLRDKYAFGTESKWEMDSMCYYKKEHELQNVNTNKYSIENFFDLPSDPIVTDSWMAKSGKEFKRYKLSLIMGTVLDRDKTKHTVTLLTPQGVVTVKYYDGLFNHYNKTISELQTDKKGKQVKKKIEDSWFKRGNKLIIYGFRNGEQFFPRKYKDSIFEHTTMKITEVNDNNGDIKVQLERYK